MPKTRISEYSTTNADNTDIEGINIAEGCAPSSINNAIREIMVHLKEFQTGASGDGFTFAGGTLMTGTNTLSGTNVLSGSTTAAFAAGTVSAPSIAAHGDTNTGIFFPASDTIAFAEGGAEAMRIDSSGNVGIGVTPSDWGGKVIEIGALGTGIDSLNQQNTIYTCNAIYKSNAYKYGGTGYATAYQQAVGLHYWYTAPSGTAGNAITFTQAMTLDASGNLVVGGATWYGKVTSVGGTFALVTNTASQRRLSFWSTANGDSENAYIQVQNDGATTNTGEILFATKNSGGTLAERARITAGGDFLVGKTALDVGVVGVELRSAGLGVFTASGSAPVTINRNTSDGDLVVLRQDNVTEGTISVSGNTVSYNSFAGAHWTQLQQGRGYNPEIPRGTVMSSIGEMAEWKSVIWDEVIEHPAVEAVEAVEGKEAVLDEEGNVIEPAVEAVAGVEGKEAWTETINKREAYLGNLAVGATFTEDGVTKTVVDDGNERLPKVKISDVVGDKAVYGVFQTYDEVQDMLVTALGAFVVRIASGVTVQIGDLLESNGDGCAKVQDDDVIRSKTIGKVTSTVKTATYADGSYTVPCVLYCG